MFTKQLSIFLENKSGSLSDVTDVLAQAGINRVAMCVADSSDYGILRCVVSDPQRAGKVLREHGYAVKTTDVVGFAMTNESGSMAKILKHLSDSGAAIEYLYSFNNGQQANVIIRTIDMEACIGVLKQNRVRILTEEELYNL